MHYGIVFCFCLLANWIISLFRFCFIRQYLCTYIYELVKVCLCFQWTRESLRQVWMDAQLFIWIYVCMYCMYTRMLSLFESSFHVYAVLPITLLHEYMRSRCSVVVIMEILSNFIHTYVSNACMCSDSAHFHALHMQIFLLRTQPRPLHFQSVWLSVFFFFINFHLAL